MRRAESKIANPTARNQTLGDIVEQIILDAGRQVIVSRIGIMEYRNNVAKDWRDTQNPQFDKAWAQESIRDVMALVARHTILVADDPPRATQKACALVDLATREHGIAFKVWDAVHLFTALAVGHETGKPVEFVTTDKDFDRFVRVYPHFGRVVTVRNIDPGGW